MEQVARVTRDDERAVLTRRDHHGSIDHIRGTGLTAKDARGLGCRQIQR